MRTHKKAETGVINAFTVAAPGAGLPFSVIPTIGQFWLIRSLTFTFTTDANVANRGVVWAISDGASDYSISFTNFIHGASIAIIYSLVDKPTTVNRQGFGRIEDGLPGNCWINGGYYLRVSADNIQVGDAFTDIRGIAEQWIDN